MKLSVIIITKNEEAHIQACLDSVAFADEVIVVDSGSTDKTCEIVRAWGAALTVTEDWPGFGPQKNRALEQCTGEWVLSIDADERVTPELAAAIRAVLSDSSRQGYKIPRLSQFAGRWIRHSGWWPDYVVRLFRRDAGRFTPAKVHERVEVQGGVGTLSAHFLHYPYASLEIFINKINHYSSVAAQAAFERGKRTSVLGPFGHGFWTFLRHYLFRRGFLDGWQGLFLAGMAATGSFYRYVKLYSLMKRSK